MKYIITGAGGFLGSNLIQNAQKQGHTVLPVSFRPCNAKAFIASLESLVTSFNPDVVLNAAAAQNTGDNPSDLQELVTSNITIPSSICSVLNKHAPKTLFVTFGTSWQFAEDGSPQPFNAYAASKAALESFLKHFAQDGLRCASLILYDTFGPNDRRNKITNLVLSAVMSGQPLDMSGGEQTINLVHIDDVVDAVEKTITALGNETSGVHHQFAVRGKQSLTVREVALEALRHSANQDKNLFRFGVYPYRARERFSLNHKTAGPPGWTPKKQLGDWICEISRI